MVLRCFRTGLVACALCALELAPLHAETLTGYGGEDVATRTLERRAVEAMIWGRPPTMT